MEALANINRFRDTDAAIPGYLNLIQRHIQKKSNYLDEFGDLFPFIIHINRLKDFRLMYVNKQIEQKLNVSTNDAILYNLSLWRELYKEDSFRFVQKYTRENIHNLLRGKIIKYLQILKPQNSNQFVEMLTYRKLLNDTSYLSISLVNGLFPSLSANLVDDLISNNNKYKISNRELEILKFVSKGMTSSKIAQKLYISKHTVDTHRRSINRKLEVSNSIHAYKKALDLGLI